MPDAAAGQLPDGFVGQRAAAGDDADVAFFMDVAGGDADAAAAFGIRAAARGDDARAIGADQTRCPALQGLLDFHHVVDGDAFGDANDQGQPGIGRFENGVGGEGRRDEDGGDRRAGFARSGVDRVKDRHFFAGMFKGLAPFARSDAGDHLCAVIKGELCVPRAKTAGDALHEDLGVWFNEDGHGICD